MPLDEQDDEQLYVGGYYMVCIFSPVLELRVLSGTGSSLYHPGTRFVMLRPGLGLRQRQRPSSSASESSRDKCISPALAGIVE